MSADAIDQAIQGLENLSEETFRNAPKVAYGAIAEAIYFLRRIPPASPQFRDPSSAPKDGSILRLLVLPDAEANTSFEDTDLPYETIGWNTLKDTGEDYWWIAGWDWYQDRITEGVGEVIGWLPYHSADGDLPSP